MQDLTYFPLPAELQRHFATLHCGRLPAGEQVRFPALLGQVWFCRTPVWWLPPGSSLPERLPPCALIGFTSGSFEVFLEEPAPIYGCGLWPLGWAEIVRRPASACADQAVDASQLWPDLVSRWPKGRAGDSDEAAFADALLDFAYGLTARSQPSAEAKRITIIDGWLNTEEGPSELVGRLGVSQRQAERITARTHGGSPRLIASKWRALRCAAELRLVPEGHDIGRRYADQSHFIREFRRFVGTTPGTYRKESALAGRILADKWHVESDHPLAPYKNSLQ